MPFASNSGVRLYWEEHGSGPPVLLIMGLSFTHEMWFRLLPRLAESCRVILFDNRGMGRSDVPDGAYSIHQMAKDAAAVLDAAGISAAHVIGASMGGMIAQEMALQFPDKVLSLVLACTSHGGLLSRWPSFADLKGLGFRQSERRKREAAWIPLLYAPSTPTVRIQEDLDVRCHCTWSYKGFFGQFRGILPWSSYFRLPSLRVPTLVVHGACDRLIPPRNGRVVALRIRGAEFRLIENAGHMIMTDQPEACLDLIAEFLLRVMAGNSPGPRPL